MNELHYQIDLLKAMNQNLTGKEQMYRLAFESSNNAFLFYSSEKKEVETFGKWSQYFDFTLKKHEEFIKILDMVQETYKDALKKVLFPEKLLETEAACTCLKKDGRTWLLFKVNAEYTSNSVLIHKLISVSDVSKEIHRQEELSYLAYYDTMTGLYNRNFFIQNLNDYILKAKEKNDLVSVLFIDIDDFRKINDSMGMLVGDELVQQFGQALKGLVTDPDIIAAHFNSDIFCMAIYNPTGENTSDNLAKKINERLQHPFRLSNGIDLSITVCIGIADFPESAEGVLELVNCAEIVMFRCKSVGKNMVKHFDIPILNDFIQNARLDTRLKEAVLAENHFTLQYQPQFYTGNKKLRGVEALIRWKDADNHMISPGVFIPIAEKNGTIIPIGNWVLEESIRQYSEWRTLYSEPLIMSINISALQFMREDFEDKLISIIQKYNVEPQYIEVEVTESVLIEDIVVVTRKLKHLREFGIRVSIDDFGTGFSSLAYLKELPIDTLKIDKQFIDTVLTDSPTRIITESIIKMVKTLGYEAIAEGVEEKQQYDYLHTIGCDVIQGYFLGRPQSVQDIEKLLMKGKY